MRKAKLIESDGKQNPRQISPKMKVMLQQVVGAISKHYNLSMISPRSANCNQSDDDSIEEKLRIEAIDKEVTFMFERKREIKKMSNKILKKNQNLLGEGVDKTFIFEQLEASGLYELEPERQLMASYNLRDKLEEDNTVLSSKERVAAMIKAAVEPHKVSFVEQKLAAAEQALAAARQERLAAEQALAAARQERLAAEQERLAAEQELAALRQKRAAVEKALAAGRKKPEQLRAYLALLEENAVVKQGLNSSTAHMLTQIGTSEFQPEANTSKKKRSRATDEETAEDSSLSKKGKTDEVVKADQASLSFIDSASSPDDGLAQEQTSTSNPPSPR